MKKSDVIFGSSCFFVFSWLIVFFLGLNILVVAWIVYIILNIVFGVLYLYLEYLRKLDKNPTLFTVKEVLVMLDDMGKIKYGDSYYGKEYKKNILSCAKFDEIEENASNKLKKLIHYRRYNGKSKFNS